MTRFRIDFVNLPAKELAWHEVGGLGSREAKGEAGKRRRMGGREQRKSEQTSIDILRRAAGDF